MIRKCCATLPLVFILKQAERAVLRRSGTNVIRVVSQYMATKLYVGNLSYNTTNDSLRDAFAQAGAVVSATVLSDRMSGRSRGFGFVEMDEADAAKAIEMWNGKDLDGRKLRVNEARPMADRAPRRFERSPDRRSF